MHTIYLIKNTANYKCYVGKTSKTAQERWRVHCYEAKRHRACQSLYNAIRKYGEAAFTIREIDNAETEAEANDLERAYILLYMTNNRDLGYNLTLGGDGVAGLKQSEETRQKRSVALRGRQLSDEHRRKLSEVQLGNKNAFGCQFTDERRRNISLALRDNTNSTGNVPTNETRHKI